MAPDILAWIVKSVALRASRNLRPGDERADDGDERGDLESDKPREVPGQLVVEHVQALVNAGEPLVDGREPLVDGREALIHAAFETENGVAYTVHRACLLGDPSLDEATRASTVFTIHLHLTVV